MSSAKMLWPSKSTSCCPSAMVSTEMLSLLVPLLYIAVALSCGGVVVVSAEASLVAPFLFAAMWRDVMNRRMGAKLLVIVSRRRTNTTTV